MAQKSKIGIIGGGIVTHNCFPKDICALIYQLESAGFDPKLIKAAWEQNKAIRPEIGKDS